uniref:LigA n=1 Tax=Parastrongyloides trichosuri TaxID=131310 RepID=A0A0N4ZIQ8_PARTI
MRGPDECLGHGPGGRRMVAVPQGRRRRRARVVHRRRDLRPDRRSPAPDGGGPARAPFRLCISAHVRRPGAAPVAAVARGTARGVSRRPEPGLGRRPGPGPVGRKRRGAGDRQRRRRRERRAGCGRGHPGAAPAGDGAGAVHVRLRQRRLRRRGDAHHRAGGLRQLPPLLAGDRGQLSKAERDRSGRDRPRRATAARPLRRAGRRSRHSGMRRRPDRAVGHSDPGDHPRRGDAARRLAVAPFAVAAA